MVALICGGASSGKSEYAENLIRDLSEGSGMTYLATMEKKSPEAKIRIADHERRREGKGFTLAECERDIASVSDSLMKNVLLECLPTLVSNEMFIHDDNDIRFNADVSEKIFDDIKTIASKCDNLVIVTNDVFSDGCIYKEMTEKYKEQLGTLSCKIAAISDLVVYMTCGCAEVIKGKYA